MVDAPDNLGDLLDRWGRNSLVLSAGSRYTSAGMLHRCKRELEAVLKARPSYDLIQHLLKQMRFSYKTFGPGARTQMVVDHIRRELEEIEAKPDDLEEWIDVILLAMDGAYRAGYDPTEIAASLKAKLAKNEAREWPDWRTHDPNKAIEHVRESP